MGLEKEKDWGSLEAAGLGASQAVDGTAPAPPEVRRNEDGRPNKDEAPAGAGVFPEEEAPSMEDKGRKDSGLEGSRPFALKGSIVSGFAYVRTHKFTPWTTHNDTRSGPTPMGLCAPRPSTSSTRGRRQSLGAEHIHTRCTVRRRPACTLR